MFPDVIWSVAVALPVGFAAGYFVSRAKADRTPPAALSPELTEKLARFQAENEVLARQAKALEETENLLRMELNESSIGIARLETLLDERQQTVERQGRENAERLKQLSEQHQERLAQLAAEQVERQQYLERIAVEQQERQKEQAKLQQAQFEALSQQTLKTLKTELEEKARREATLQQTALDERLGNILKPLREVLDQNAQKVQEIEKQHLEDNVSLKKHIELIVEETRGLVSVKNKLADALSNSKGRGDWGEMELIRLLEHSGLLEGVHYEAQRQENGLRPDVTIRLSNRRVLYVDAKTILVNLEKLLAAEDDEEGAVERKKHAAALEKEVLSLSLKAYEANSGAGSSLDFVILYVPRESMLRAALEERPLLMEMAFQKRIILASPLVLMSILKTVAYGWDQAQLSQKANEIQKLGQELHRRAAIFMERFDDIGNKLETLSKSYENATKSFRGRQGILPQMRKFEEYGVKSDKRLPEINHLEEEEERSADFPAEQALLPVSQRAKNQADSVTLPATLENPLFTNLLSVD